MTLSFTSQSILHSVILSTLVNLDLCQLHKGCYISTLPQIQPRTSHGLHTELPGWSDYLLGNQKPICHLLSETLTGNINGSLRLDGLMAVRWRQSSYELGYYVTEGKKRSWEIKLMSNLGKKWDRGCEKEVQEVSQECVIPLLETHPSYFLHLRRLIAEAWTIRLPTVV